LHLEAGVAGRKTTGLLPVGQVVPKPAWQAPISGIKPGHSIYGHYCLSCTGSLTVEDKMLIGYARVSTDDQNLDLQRDALRLAGCEKIYEDRISGAKAARPGLAMALEVARAGDVLTVWRLDRLGRSLHDLILLGRKLDEMGIGLMSVQEKIDTSSSGGRLVFHMFVALAEFERNLVRERTQAWLSAARARGRKGGRPKVLEPAQRQLVAKLYAEKQHTIGEICRMMGISKPTLYNYIAEANA
jgi:DNA invertase Pin-like site-specific DNA recombinase